ncbi:type II secretion system F family protein [Geomonas paludis]|uniref:Type II secretion system F family protein n=1 Tax=Geomonas paludis TaxID=2740185 RepID=A0A6V8MWI8_9BACT|nr:type II secretion system F family protein [Geomonas paludis]UPU34462.1 type II secretion system F family protein [Geomonas paludis]GFO64450.1 hypothetical protein GMPD_23690 [Geomonas paludis]
MRVTLLLVFISVFVGTFPLVAAVRATRQAHQIRRRVRKLAVSAGVRDEGSDYALLRETTVVEQVLARLPITRSIKTQVDLSGVQLSTTQFLLLVVMAWVTGFVVLYIWKESMAAAFLAALAFGALPFAYIVKAKHRRNELFAEQLPDALTMVSRSLRAGHSLAAAVELVGQELPEPVGGLFRQAYEQQKLGVRMVECLLSLKAKIESPDFNFFITIIRINRESGGNLSEILDKLADTLRARLQIRRQVDVLTAEGRISGHILVALPAAMFVVFYLLRPGYLDVFFTEGICQYLLGAAVLGQVAGYLMIRRIVNISI